MPVTIGKTPIAADHTGGRPAGPAIHAVAAGVDERRYHHLAAAHRADLRADVLDDSDELVPDASPARGQAAVGPEVRTADATRGDPDEGVPRGGQGRVGDGVQGDLAGGMQDGCSHSVDHSPACGAPRARAAGSGSGWLPGPVTPPDWSFQKAGLVISERGTSPERGDPDSRPGYDLPNAGMTGGPRV